MIKRRLIRCGGHGSAPRKGETTVDLALWGSAKNVDLKIGDLSNAMVANVPPVLTDLLELASYIHAADQAVPRGGKTGGTAGELWRRRLRFVVPVREPGVWSRPAVLAALVDVLGFLSEDEFEFEFVELKSPPAIQTYLEFGGTNPTKLDAEEVLLFSGGLDSLAGACETVIGEGRRPILVTHRSATKLWPRQDRLIADLRERSGQDRLAYVPIRVEKAAVLNREYTQRTRSFLFASLAASVATMAGAPRVRFFENGVVSLNLPIAEQVVGARNTRTTHPRAIEGFSRFFGELLGNPLPVDNAYIWKTKADIVKVLAQHGCADLIGDSVSCTRVYKLTNLHTHCGECSQCLDRRFATLASGLGDHDPSHRYATNENELDLLTCPRSDGEPRTMAELYYKRAKVLAGISERDFFSRFAGEVGRMLRHLPGTADDNARRILDLHHRHGEEVVSVLEQGVARHARAIIEDRIDASSLLIMAMPRGSLREQAEAVTTGPCSPTPEDAGHVLRLTTAGVDLDGVPIIAARKAKAQWAVLRYFVNQWASQVGNRQRYCRLEKIHRVLRESGATKAAKEEATRQHIVRLKHAFSERVWAEKQTSIGHNAVIETSPDGKGYRLNPTRLAVEVEDAAAN